MSKEVVYVEHDGFFFNPPANITRGGKIYKVYSHFTFKDNATSSAKYMKDRGFKAFVVRERGTKLKNAKILKGGVIYFVYGCPPTDEQRRKRQAKEEKAWKEKLKRSK